MLIPKELIDQFYVFLRSAYGVKLTVHDPKAGNEHARWMMGGRIFAVIDHEDNDQDTLLEVISGDKEALQKLESIWLSNFAVEDENAE